MLPLAEKQRPIGRTAKSSRLVEDRRKHRSKVTGRAVDDPQHLGGRGLLLQGLARLGDQPRILHRNDRLRREVLQQRDLLVGKWLDFLAEDVNRPKQGVVLTKGDGQQSAHTTAIRHLPGDRLVAVFLGVSAIGDVYDAISPENAPQGDRVRGWPQSGVLTPKRCQPRIGSPRRDAMKKITVKGHNMSERRLAQ